MSSGGYPQTPELARLSAAERRRIMEEFVDELFHGLDTVDPAVGERMRTVAVDLPDDPAVVLDRMESAANDRLARYRELLSTVKGSGPAGAHREEFAWVVAALRARAAG